MNTPPTLTRGQALLRADRAQSGTELERLQASNRELRAALLALVNYVDAYKWGSVWTGRPHDLCDRARQALGRSP